MTFITTSDKERITAAIKEVESKTSGEIVTVIARESDGYAYIPLLWASGLALIVPLPLVFLDLPMDPIHIYLLQLAAFAGFGLLFRLSPLKMRLIPKSVKQRRAGRLAREQFLAQGLHHTEGRTGVLLFVSVAEHYVEVLADSGINNKVEPGAWDELIAKFVNEVKQGRTTEGFLGAIEACGRLLAQHFPGSTSDKNELPNHLIEI